MMRKSMLSMKRFRKFFQAIRGLSLVLALIIFVVLGGSFYFWNAKNATPPPLPQALPTSLPPEEADTTTNEEEENEDDEDEDSYDLNSPSWTLLKTALPSSFFEPIAKVGTPTVAIILTGLGLNKDWTAQLLVTFKGKVTFAFSPYSSNLQEQLQEAAALENQLLVALPMEPYAFPNPDPGPYTLLTGVKAEENISKTKAILKKIPNGVGMIGDYGSRFTLSPVDLEPVLKEIKGHGSTFVDPYTTLYSQVQETCKALGMACPQVHMTIAPEGTTTQRDDFFKRVIQSTKENGIIIISVPAIPTFTDYLLEWIADSEKKGINFTTIAHLKTLELSPGTSGEHQGMTNVSK